MRKNAALLVFVLAGCSGTHLQAELEPHEPAPDGPVSPEQDLGPMGAAGAPAPTGPNVSPGPGDSGLPDEPEPTESPRYPDDASAPSPSDAGVEAPEPDAGGELDAGTQDAGEPEPEPDAGEPEPDAGEPPADAGEPEDAGEPVDAGPQLRVLWTAGGRVTNGPTGIADCGAALVVRNDGDYSSADAPLSHGGSTTTIEPSQALVDGMYPETAVAEVKVQARWGGVFVDVLDWTVSPIGPDEEVVELQLSGNCREDGTANVAWTFLGY